MRKSYLIAPATRLNNAIRGRFNPFVFSLAYVSFNAKRAIEPRQNLAKRSVCQPNR
jgi:hypothetical protein